MQFILALFWLLLAIWKWMSSMVCTVDNDAMPLEATWLISYFLISEMTFLNVTSSNFMCVSMHMHDCVHLCVICTSLCVDVCMCIQGYLPMWKSTLSVCLYGLPFYFFIITLLNLFHGDFLHVNDMFLLLSTHFLWSPSHHCQSLFPTSPSSFLRQAFSLSQ